MWVWWTQIPLWQRVLGGLILGLVFGLLLPNFALSFSLVGELFLRAIKLLVVPLVLLTLISGVVAMDEPGRCGRVGAKALGLYLLTTIIAIVIGVSAGLVAGPGEGVSLLGAGAAVERPPLPAWRQVVINLIPDNPVRALADGNILQIIAFALLFGVALNLTGDRAKPVKDVVSAGATVMITLTGLVMETAPFGVFSLVAAVTATHGLEVVAPLFKLVAVVFAACLLHALVTYGALVAFFARLDPRPFYRGIIDAMAVAFSTASSSGTLPVTLRCVQENLGVSRPVAGFILPLGATINMDGTAIYQGVAAVFIAQAYGIALTPADLFTIMATAVLAAVGTAGVPGAGLIMLATVLTSIGLPLDGVALVAGVDRLLDMARTTVNIVGDAAVALVVGKSETDVDEARYGSPPPV